MFARGAARVKTGGFTLVELMVVIALIAVLAGILLVAAAKARESAHVTTCMSNLHQFSVALRMYDYDYGGDPVSGMPLYLCHLYPRYVPSKEIFVCPSISPAQGHNQAGWYENYCYKYGMPWAAPADAPREFKVLRVTYEYMCTIRADGVYETENWWDWYAQRGDAYPCIIDWGHTTQDELEYNTGLLLILRMDGHVEKERVRYPSWNAWKEWQL